MSTDKFNRNNCLQRQSTVIYPIWVCPYFGRGWVGSNVRTCYLRTERKMSRAMWSWTPAHGGQTLFLECRTRGRTPTLSRAIFVAPAIRTSVTARPASPDFLGQGVPWQGGSPTRLGCVRRFWGALGLFVGKGLPTYGGGRHRHHHAGVLPEGLGPDRGAVSPLVGMGRPACGSQRVNAGYRPDNDNLPPRPTPAHPGLLKYRHRSD
jgi:hypothetical protein